MSSMLWIVIGVKRKSSKRVYKMDIRAFTTYEQKRGLNDRRICNTFHFIGAVYWFIDKK